MIESGRRLMVATNPYWPFSVLNPLPYRLAVNRFAGLCRREPVVRSSHLRHSLTRANWLPGSSDIDVTVLTGEGLSAAQEYAMLAAFWRRVGRLQRVLPMLKDVAVLPQHYLPSWSRFSIVGHEVCGWQLLTGASPAASAYLVTPERLEMDSLFHALSLYRYTFFDRLSRPAAWTQLALTDLRRLTAKILRYAGGDGAAEGAPLDVVSDPFDLGGRLLAVLEKRCRQLLPDIIDSYSSRGLPDWQLLFDTTCRPARRDSQEAPTLPTEAASFVDSILRSHGDTFVVLADGLDAPVLSRCLRAALMSSVGATAPVALPRSVFDTMVRVVQPYLFVQLNTDRRLLAGEDPMVGLSLPSPFFFAHRLLSMVSASRIMMFPRDWPAVLAADSGWFAGRSFQSLLRRSLLVKLFLERGQVAEWFPDPLAAWQTHYPEIGKRMAGLLREGPGPAPAGRNQAWFELTTGITEDIHRGIASRSIDEALYAPRQGPDCRSS